MRKKDREKGVRGKDKKGLGEKDREKKECERKRLIKG